MAEVNRYKVVKMLTEDGNKISYDPHGPEMVTAENYDRLKAENDILRQQLADNELQARADAAFEEYCQEQGN